MSTPPEASGGEADLPLLSFVVAALDEREGIEACLDSILGQDYPASRLEVAVVDGGSRDGTQDVVRHVAARDPRVTLLHNPAGIAAAAFNIGIRSTRGELVSLASAHSTLDPGYARRLVEAFAASGAALVGGRAVARAHERSPTASAIVRAMSSPVGVGNARFRYSDRPGWVDTAFPGAYRRSLLEQIGLFDETLVRNQDDDLHYRARRHGHRMWFDPGLVSYYVPRSSLPALWRQYGDYGRYRAHTLRKHRRLGAVRQLAPAALVLGLGVAAAGWPVPRRHRGRVRVAVVGGYAGALALGTAGAARHAPPAELVRVPVAVASLHLSYGLGFWAGLVRRDGRARGGRS